ncbi:MAG: hypothetical protein KF838_14260 [Phycisphaeraceae bacterium]|nr:MAG: hypothetical protein KF838_14260 [Phycisphaeraceae bacterium]
MAKRTHSAIESNADSGDGPGALDRAIDRFSMLHVLSRRVLQAWAAWQASIANSPVGERPDTEDVAWGLAEGITTLKELTARKAERRARAPRMFQSWCRHYDAYDDMVFAVDRWREALDAAKASLPEVARWVDDERGPPLKRWTAEAQRLLGKFGGHINRYTEAEVPARLDAAGFEACMAEVYAKLSDLKSIPHHPEPESAPAGADMVSAVNAAYGALMEFLDVAATLAHMARHASGPNARGLGLAYGRALVSWLDLTALLTPDVRGAARSCYSAGSPPIRVGKLRPSPSVIEAVADGLGVAVRNAVYQDRLHPLESRASESWKEAKARLGTQAPMDAWAVLESDWNKSRPEIRERALLLLKCPSIEFDDLLVRAGREAEAALATGADRATPDLSSETVENLLKKLLAQTVQATTQLSQDRKATDWKQVQALLLAKRERGESYTDSRTLAKECGCSTGTVLKAIKASTLLRGWAKRSGQGAGSRKTQQMNEVVRDRATQRKEAAPDQYIPPEDVDATMAELVAQSKPAEQERLRALSPDQQRRIAQLYQEQQKDERAGSSASRARQRRGKRKQANS